MKNPTHNTPLIFNQTNLSTFVTNFKRGDFILIAGRKGMGSAALLAWMENQVREGSPSTCLSFDYTLTKNIRKPPGLMQNEDNKLSFTGFKTSLPLDYLIAQINLLETKENTQYIFISAPEAFLEAGNKDKESHGSAHTISASLKKLAVDSNLCLIVAIILPEAINEARSLEPPAIADVTELAALAEKADTILISYYPEYYGILEDEYGRSLQDTMEVYTLKNKSENKAHFRIKHSDIVSTS